MYVHFFCKYKIDSYFKYVEWLAISVRSPQNTWGKYGGTLILSVPKLLRGILLPSPQKRFLGHLRGFQNT